MINPTVFMTFLFVGMTQVSATAATIEEARTKNGGHLWALKLEGDIVPGDASRLLNKLLRSYLWFGPLIDTIYLRSKGGDVEEAMQMGQIIRRLRLKTEAPIWEKNELPLSLVLSDNKENFICASACFLIYAAGADRAGNYLALHRPYLSKEGASKITDAEYEAAQKAEIVKVRAYLENMEVDRYWIDKMMATNSQDAYIIPYSEVNRHPMDKVPSIEEIELAQCTDTDADVKRKLAALPPGKASLTPEQEALLAQIVAEAGSFQDCKDKVLSDIRKAAFEREIDQIVMSQCVNLTAQEVQVLKTYREREEARKHKAEPITEQKEPINPFAQFDPDSPYYRGESSPENSDLIAKLKTKAFAFSECKREALDSISYHQP